MGRLVKARPRVQLTGGASDGDNYRDRMAKYIPGEIVAGYVSIMGVIMGLGTEEPARNSHRLGRVPSVPGVDTDLPEAERKAWGASKTEHDSFHNFLRPVGLRLGAHFAGRHTARGSGRCCSAVGRWWPA